MYYIIYSYNWGIGDKVSVDLLSLSINGERFGVCVRVRVRARAREALNRFLTISTKCSFELSTLGS